MESALYAIVGIVAVVLFAGLFATSQFGADAVPAVTGNVVAASCGQCAGYAPVCGQRNHRLVSYANACEASCDGAEVVAPYACERIPQS